MHWGPSQRGTSSATKKRSGSVDMGSTAVADGTCLDNFGGSWF